MTPTEHFLVLLSFGLGVLCVKHIRNYDIHEQEPIKKMLAVTLWGGGLSVVICLFLYSAAGAFGFRSAGRTTLSFIGVGFIEEAAKLAALFVCCPFIRDELNEPTDGLIYMACVALGFSLIENYMYATSTPDSSGLVLFRLTICTPVHIACSILMGLPFYCMEKGPESPRALVKAYLIASVCHALYDMVVVNVFHLAFVPIVFGLSYSWCLSLLAYTAAVSPFRRPLRDFVRGYESPQDEQGLECLGCGSTGPKKTYRLGSIVLQKCDQCRCYVTTKESLFWVFHHFGSTFEDLSTLYRPGHAGEDEHSTLYRGNRVSDEKGVACFYMERLNPVLEELSRKTIRDAERRWWYPQRRSDNREQLPPQA